MPAQPHFTSRSRQTARIAESWSCLSEAELWAVPDCPDCEYVLAALRRGIGWEQGQLEELPQLAAVPA
jgi:hypothetical protein